MSHRNNTTTTTTATNNNSNNKAAPSQTKEAYQQQQKQQPQDTLAEEKEEEEEVIDHPCWGSPQQCSLRHLLSKLNYHYDKLILFQDDQFFVMNKPPDVRMDGARYPATLHKLVSVVMAPDRAVALDQLEQTTKTNTTNTTTTTTLRHCHQLDYATSGAILFAKTKAAANQAQLAFEARAVTKSYLAVLHGHVVRKNSWPVVDNVAERWSDIERGYRKQRQKKNHNNKKHKNKPNTFAGYVPGFCLYQMWQRQQLGTTNNNNNNNGGNSEKTNHTNTKKRKRPWKQQQQQTTTEPLTESEWDAVWASLPKKDLLVLDPKVPWKVAKQQQPYAPILKSAFDQAATVYNAIQQSKQQQQTCALDGDDTVASLPPVFVDNNDKNNNTFYVFAPIGQDDSDFCVRIPAETAEQPPLSQFQFPTCNHQHQSFLDSLVGPPTTTMDYKPCLTRLTILEHTYYADMPVTVVQLQPHTGRRHQLRLHTALLGHAVLGDVSYDNGTVNKNKNNNRKNAPRLCLHAHHLQWLGRSATAPPPFRVVQQQQQQEEGGGGTVVSSSVLEIDTL